MAIQWAAADDRVKAVVALEPFATMSDAVVDFTRYVMGWKKFLFSEKGLRDAAARGAQIAGFDVNEANPLKAIAAMKTPVLLVHGTADRHLPPEHSRRLHAAAPDHSELVLMEGDGHLTLWIRHFEELRGRTVAWLGEKLKE